MNSEFYKNVVNSSAYRSSRDENAQLILTNSQLFPHLFAIAFNTGDKNHHKACWILELVLEKQPHLLSDYLDDFCENLSKFSNESALRPISKICMFLSQHISLTPLQEEQITEKCFDWLIQEKCKVATKAYSIRTLYELGKKQDWIYPELKRILTDDYRKHTAAYKAVAREILKKIK
ncbi:hypothetical protein [Flavobacterium frigoris]|uniref:Adenylosuccinate lyase n=1 Tax=Flavobacterium frigoris (strain PS1) TaxID=1086011 RepID=H7FMF2_FLAFP|nr:hypothetical protein [Flavobacterium frigoris]EIA10326.1 hypothetical protein HJ01_00421 [Flavobacterium frigoris PS1]